MVLFQVNLASVLSAEAHNQGHFVRRNPQAPLFCVIDRQFVALGKNDTNSVKFISKKSSLKFKTF